MLEILLIVRLTKSLSTRATQKGRSKMWGGLLPLLWIIGELTGFVVGFAMGFDDLPVYGLALGFAAVGACTSFLVVHALGHNEPQPQYAYQPTGMGPGFDPSNPYSPPGG